MNSDGIVKGNILEFKLVINDVNKTLFQAIKYLSKMRLKGVSCPANILLVSLNQEVAYLFQSKDYFEDIQKVYFGSASVDNSGFIPKSKPVVIDYSSIVGMMQLMTTLQEDAYMAVEIDENSIVAWAKRYYKEVKNASKGDFLGDDETKTIGEIRQPQHFKGLILPYTGETNAKFKYLMDKLNDTFTQKNLGAFYTPAPYCKKIVELVDQAIDRVPDGNDYIILDRCAGTGNLEQYLSDEQLSHCILSTYEYYEYKVLVERLGDRVRHIIPPLENGDPYDNGRVTGANALSKEYLDNEIIQGYLDREDVTVILLENPPYASSTSMEHQKAGNAKAASIWKEAYIVQEMKKEIKGNVSNDMVNVFIWSAFKYYLKKQEDSYILLAPLKYWNINHLVDKHFINGFAFNKKHFGADPSCISAILWANISDTHTKLRLNAFDIDKDNDLKNEGFVDVNKTFNTMSSQYYDKRLHIDDIEQGVLVDRTGYETSKRASNVKALRNENILGYLMATGTIATNGRLHCLLTTTGLSDGSGFYLRKDNYLEKLPLFSAARIATFQREWKVLERIVKSGDGASKFYKDLMNGILTQKLLKNLLYIIFDHHNHMVTFEGTDKYLYKNELCLDITHGDTIASKDLKKLVITPKEQQLLNLWDKILIEAKQSPNYNPKYTYGFYQVITEINTFTKDDKNRTVYDNPILNSHIKTMKALVRTYYNEEIVDFLLEYEFLK